MDLDNLTPSAYERFRPARALDGAALRPSPSPPMDALRTLREALDDPRIVAWRRADGRWFVGTLTRRAGGRAGVRELDDVDDLGPRTIAALRSRAGDRDKALGAIRAKAAAQAKVATAGIKAARAEADDRDWKERVKPALEARGARNRPVDDVKAARRRRDRIVERATLAGKPVPPEAYGARIRTVRHRAPASADGRE